MKTFNAVLTNVTLTVFVLSNAEACQDEHGYTKTAKLVEQRTVSTEKPLSNFLAPIVLLVVFHATCYYRRHYE